MSAGFDVKVYGFDSGLYNESLTNLSFPIERLIKRDKTQGKLKKIYSFGQEIRKILNENSTNDVFYLFGYEITSIAWLLGCKHYIYEEADVTASRVKNSLIRNAMLWVDKRIIKKSKLTVFTSEGFSDYLFGKKKLEKVIILPNKLSHYFDAEKKAAVAAKNIDKHHIRFGFVGLIRYPNTINRFAKVIGRFYPQHEFHYYGTLDKPSFWDSELDTFVNVYNHGPFLNPTEQPQIYASIDMSVVCYDTSSMNVRIAEPNKLYESIFFETPIIVSEETFLAKRVKELGVGYAINASDDNQICAFIDSLSNCELKHIQGLMHEIPIEKLTDDATEFIKKLELIVRK